MATDTSRRSFKDKAKERLASFRLKARASQPEARRDAEETSPNNDSGLGGSGLLGGSGGGGGDRADMAAHGHLNPLSWDNLPQAIRDKIESSSEMLNAQQQDTNGEKVDKMEKREESTKKPRPQSCIEYVNVAEPLSPKKEPPEKSKRRSRHVTQPRGTLEHTVSDRETLTSIAAQFDTTPSELKNLNKLSSTFIFPGQVLYVPDKEYVPSPQPTPTPSPTEEQGEVPGSGSHHGSLPGSQPASQPGTPDIPLVRQVDRSKLPGHAERQKVAEEGQKEAGAGGGPPRPLSEDEAQRLDQECHERFIKVNVKHITDGQGVVSGVLLVTPNAIMFDPNVSDPLVIEHGADAYGMMAPMETIISAAMYHDIAAMKLKGMTKEEQEEAISHQGEVYHAKDCPMYQRPLTVGQPVAADSEDASGGVDKPVDDRASPLGGAKPQVLEGRNEVVGGDEKNKEFKRFRQDSACSCGAELMSPEESKARFGVDSGILEETDDADFDGLMFTASGAGGPGEESFEGAQASSSSPSSSQGPGTAAGVPGSGPATEASAAAAEMPPVCSEGAGSSGPSAADSQEQQQLSGAVSDGESHHRKSEQALAPGHAEVGPDTEDSADKKTSPKRGPRPLPAEEWAGGLQEAASSQVKGPEEGEEGDDVVFDSSVSPSVPVPRAGTGGAEAGGPPSGILSRAVGSITSLGSSIASNSPNFSSIVDFSSGLFARTQDERGRVKDVSELGTPPRTPWMVGDEVSEPRPVNELESEGVFIDRAVPEPAPQAEAPLSTDDAATTSAGKKPEIEIENAVKMEDKAAIFKSLDELIPRPARQYEDPPLYLCLKVGKPINKRISQNCPIESYMKKRTKPEYWFSIPRDKVDHLYAFFVQWSPNIYGGEDEIDPKERGFVVINDSDEDDDMDVVEDHFKQERRLLRQMTKDWEMVNKAMFMAASEQEDQSQQSDVIDSDPFAQIVNLEEARRRMSMAEEESIPIPEFSDPSTILSEEQIKKITKSLPARAEGYPWTLVYSSDKHGFSLKTLYRSMVQIDSPILLLIKDTCNEVFGGLLSGPPKLSDHFYGTGESFLFSFYPEFKKYTWTGQNSFFIKGNADCLAVGAGEGSFGLWLDGDIYHGRTQPCQTFDNDLLTKAEDFVVKGLEAWAFI